MRHFLLLLLACRALGGAHSLTDGSFNGWEGDTKTTWRIEDGAFTAGNVTRTQPRNEFLCTKQEFGDFDLTLQWKLVGTEGFVNGGVQFRTKRIPNHHEVSGYQADLGAGYDGALYDESRRNKMLAQPSKEVLEKARKPLGEWNTYRIRAEGSRIRIWLNGVPTVDYTEADANIPRTGVIAVQIHGDARSQVWYRNIVIEELGPEALPAPPLNEPYALSGSDFNGWEGDTQRTWRIEDGAFVAGSLERDQPRNEYLTTKRDYGDFELTGKWRITGDTRTANGGIMFRASRVPGSHEVSGYQADLGQKYDGALYDENRRNRLLARPPAEVLSKAQKPAGEWNDYRIRVEGPRIQLWLNGVQTVNWSEPDPGPGPRGLIALQLHAVGKYTLAYKDLVITELTPSSPAAITGPAARFADPLPAPPREPFKDGKFEIRPGEVIVFTGGTNMVRLVEHGWFETSLALAAKDRKPRFRSMAWEGDTVYEQWRDMNFGSWKEQLDAVNATCVFLWFGQMEALDETRDDAAFEQAAARLLDEFRAVTPRLVVMTPMEFDNHPWPDPIKGLPDNTPKNERVLRLGGILKKLAAQRGLLALDWPELEKRHEADDPYPRTDNGVHIGARAIPRAYQHMLTTALGCPIQTVNDNSPILIAAKSKNRLWHDCWKTMNWAFAYSDRTQQPFGKGIGDHPPLAQELEQYKPLLRAADDRIHALALGQTPQPEPEKPAAPKAQAQSPDLELATFKVRDGFEVNLFASEADGLVKPLSMRWDERGRLWAACSPSYPQLVPGEPHGDYILVCEDTNADGKADKFHKFADGLTMPMGIEFAADGGVYVCESTQLALFRDTNGDGVSDSHEVILSGFGTGDSHQMINSLRRGPDGCLWFSQGLHIFSRIETPHGIVRFDRAGLWRFDPRTWKLQGFFGNAAAGANCWGVTFDDWGQVFHCAADNTPGFFTTPGLGTWPNPPPYYNIGALAVSPVKGMCLEFINSTHLPPDLHGVLCKPVYFANQLLLYRLVEDGSGFKTEDLGPLLTSSSNAFRPLGVQTGPDGALYICDWYNPVIGHYQASYRDPNRDKIHGRIWRVTAKDRPLVRRPALESMDAAQLVEQLRSPERWVRDHARQRLAAAPELPAIAANAGAADLREWLTLHATRGHIPESLLLRCLGHDEPALRALAVRLMALHPVGEDADALRDALTRLANAVNDPHPRVRLEAVVAASYLPTARAVEIALGVLDQPRDRFIDYALGNTIRALKPLWRPALESGRMTFAGNAAHLAHLLKEDGQPDTAGALAAMVSGGKLPPEQLAPLRILLVASGNGDHLRIALDAGPLDPALVDAFIEAARTRGVRPAGDLASTFAALAIDPASGDAMPLALCRLAGAWGLPDIAKRCRALVDSPYENVAVPAVAAWAEFTGRDGLADLEKIAGDARRPVALAAVRELLRLDPDMGARLAASRLSGTVDTADIAALLGAALATKNGPGAFAEALRNAPPSAASALALLQSLATAGRHEPALGAVLRKAAGLPESASVVPAHSQEFVNRLVAEARTRGDAARGRELFRAAQSACLGCHRVDNEGGLTGPDLTAAGRGLTPELITESVLWPSRQVKEGWFLTTVTLRDGRVVSGYRAGEGDGTLALRVPGTQQTERFPLEAIASRHDAGTLMPEGLTSWMTEAQRLDLLRYLFALGK